MKRTQIEAPKEDADTLPRSLCRLVAATALLSGCISTDQIIRMPTNDTVARQRMSRAAKKEAGDLGYNLVEEDEVGTLSFQSQMENSIYWMRVSFGGIEKLGGEQGVLIKCDVNDQTKYKDPVEGIFSSGFDALINPISKSHCAKMKKMIEIAAGLPGR